MRADDDGRGECTDGGYARADVDRCDCAEDCCRLERTDDVDRCECTAGYFRRERAADDAGHCECGEDCCRRERTDDRFREHERRY